MPAITRALTATILIIAASACTPATQDDNGDDAVSDAESAELPAAGQSKNTEIDLAELPAGIAETAEAKIPGMNIAEVVRKERDGKIFFDVEGTRPDGSEVELDMLDNEGVYTVVEVQRDIAWNDVPENARAATPKNMFTPVRVIESTQNDGTIIYELFKTGTPEAPSAEISVKDGKAKMLTERWKY